MANDYYIQVSSLAANIRHFTLKRENTFLLCNRRGELREALRSEMGLYWDGTRYLSLFETHLHGELPVLLNSLVSGNDSQLIVSLTNGDIAGPGGLVAPRESIIIQLELVLGERQLLARLRATNFHFESLPVRFDILFGADFRDIFEVRGTRRPARGELLPPRHDAGELVLGYVGLDDVLRETRLRLEPAPDAWQGTVATFERELGLREQFELSVGAMAMPGGGRQAMRSLPRLLRHSKKEMAAWRAGGASVKTSNETFNQVLERAFGDVLMLRTTTPHGPFPYAGLPWYGAPFGRDALIACLELLPYFPDLAEGTLSYLAHYQGVREEAFTDEEPGKIMHEHRRGEMANLREIPFIPYYGTVDATPLFIILLAEYVRWTGNLAKLRELWPAALAALEWIERWGDRDGDGYIEYASRSARGLRNQGWKDSFDAVHHAGGELADPPIVLVEVQAYAYRARLAMAELAVLMERVELWPRLNAEAERLRAALLKDFWVEELGYLALALDGGGQPCKVVGSNPGHALWMGLLDEPQAGALVKRLMAPECFSGWGIRTLGEAELRYNPMAYHNGSVWPHDNALCVAGFKRYGYTKEVERVVSALFEAAASFADHRLPELFCGFGRQPGHGPVPYPTSCAPQVWAAGAMPFMLLQMIGLRGEALNGRLYFERPRLPGWLDWVSIHNLRCGGRRADVCLTKGLYGSSLEIIAKDPELEIIVRE